MGLQAGTILRARYRIVRPISSGGMGSVCLAEDINLADSPCAIKEVLDAALAGEQGEYIQQSFVRERNALVALEHPGIPRIRDFFQEAQNSYIVMDFIEGQSLESEVNRQLETTGKGLPHDRVVDDILQLLSIVDYLHNLKPPLLHRDIKSANIIREEKTGRLKLVDFGLARAGAETPRTANSAAHTMVGTLGFCAPEQLGGKPERASDLYSVGATMFHLLTGKAPTLSFDPMEMNLPGLSPSLHHMVKKATEPRIPDRYASATEMIAELRALQESWQAPATAPLSVVNAAPPIAPAPAGTPQWAWVGVAGLCVGVGLLVGRVARPPATTDPTATPSGLALATSRITPQPTPKKAVTQLPVHEYTPEAGHRTHPKPLRHRAEQEQLAARPSVDGGDPGYIRASTQHKLLDKSVEVDGHTVHVRGFQYPAQDLFDHGGTAREEAEILNRQSGLTQDWQYYPPKLGQDRLKIGMRGSEVGGGYVLRPRLNAVYLVEIRPAPRDHRLFNKVATEIFFRDGGR